MTPALILQAAHTGVERWSRDKVAQRREFLQCGDRGGGGGTGAAGGRGSVEGDSEVACLKVAVGAGNICTCSTEYRGGSHHLWCTAPYG